MAFPKHFFIVSAVFSSLLILSPLPAKATVSALANSVCNGAAITDREFCLDALSTPEAGACKSPNDLMKVVMKQARDAATTTSTEITAAIPLQLTNPAAAAALNKCLATYKSMIQAFTLEVQEMEEDPLSASYDSKVTGDTESECETALASAKVNLPKIDAGNASMKNYVSISFEVANAGGNGRRK